MRTKPVDACGYAVRARQDFGIKIYICGLHFSGLLSTWPGSCSRPTILLKGPAAVSAAFHRSALVQLGHRQGLVKLGSVSPGLGLQCPAGSLRTVCGSAADRPRLQVLVKLSGGSGRMILIRGGSTAAGILGGGHDRAFAAPSFVHEFGETARHQRRKDLQHQPSHFETSVAPWKPRRTSRTALDSGSCT